MKKLLLPLAWLVRTEDTSKHRQWLREMAEDMDQEPGGAVRDEIRKGSWAGPPKSNEEYGTAEATLMQTEDDEVADLLYIDNFALPGIHEAAMATGDSYYREAEDKCSEFICRAQIRSEEHPELDGGWFRAFDLKRWDYRALNTDMGWGAWCIETGWWQSWITAVLALRQLEKSVWKLYHWVL
jgi:hypothetical protein